MAHIKDYIAPDMRPHMRPTCALSPAMVDTVLDQLTGSFASLPFDSRRHLTPGHGDRKMTLFDSSTALVPHRKQYDKMWWDFNAVSAQSFFTGPEYYKKCVKDWQDRKLPWWSVVYDTGGVCRRCFRFTSDTYMLYRSAS